MNQLLKFEHGLPGRILDELDAAEYDRTEISDLYSRELELIEKVSR